MRIGIVGVRVDHRNREYLDLARQIERSGNRARMVYADSLGVLIKNGRTEICQTDEHPSGAGGKKELVEIECGVLRHLGIIRDYEQFMFRVWCMRAFEGNGVYLMNPVMGWLAASDKFGALIELARCGIRVPETEISEQMFVAYDAVKRFRSAVVKPLRSAMGFGVFKLDDPDAAMHVFSYFANINKPMYVQRYLEKEGGGDYRVIVVGGEVIGAIFRKGRGWKSNVAQGGVPRAVKIGAEMREMAIKSAGALGLEFAGVDIAVTKEGPLVLEVNPTISWQGFRKATGINPAAHIVRRLLEQARG
ncbi:MAG TPA: RimK family alpha-L-glutamate ligase [Candidatus Saccharimonadales bacterium]|nr:RimK family alpha-L-glutamate ligase [Candidatus Saccharimonadales bacterium]